VGDTTCHTDPTSEGETIGLFILSDDVRCTVMSLAGLGSNNCDEVACITSGKIQKVEKRECYFNY
jgi:hypothetical protein